MSYLRELFGQVFSALLRNKLRSRERQHRTTTHYPHHDRSASVPDHRATPFARPRQGRQNPCQARSCVRPQRARDLMCYRPPLLTVVAGSSG